MTTSNREWISVSDMMTGLMMVFLFVSIVFMERVGAEKKAIEELAVNYKNIRLALHVDLLKEFKDDLERWNAEILDDSTVRFNEPHVLFDVGDATIKPKFKRVLANFFPRYVRLMGNEKYRDSIEEVRIEGHTSSIWQGSQTLEQRYLRNAHLSQARSFSILRYCFALPEIKADQEWLTKVIRANGLAFAKPIYIRGVESRSRSRRVEFKVRTKAEERIHAIIETIRGSQRQS